MSKPTQRPSKRLSLLSDLDDLVEASTGIEADSKDRMLTGGHRGVPSSGRVPAPTRRTSVYLPAATLRRLKEVALARDCKVNDLLVEGAEAVLRESGHLPSPTSQDTS